MQSRIVYQDLKRLRDSFKHVADERVIEQWIEACLRDLAKKHIRKIKQRTPVNTGLLRNSWKVGQIKNNGSSYEIEIYIEVEYASFVEKGFRAHFVPGYWEGKQFVYDPNAKTGMQVGTPGGWVEGRFMMRISENEMEREMPAFLKRKQAQLLKDIMRGR